jgi:hypothetical protein
VDLGNLGRMWEKYYPNVLKLFYRVSKFRRYGSDPLSRVNVEQVAELLKDSKPFRQTLPVAIQMSG